MELTSIATVKIFDPESSVTFHPKIIWLEYQKGEDEILLGSSNFTKGGLCDNIEINYHTKIDENDRVYISQFVGGVDLVSETVDDDLIEIYMDNEQAMSDLYLAQRSMERKINSMFRKNDPFTDQTYDLTNQYFKYEDYETFFERNIYTTSLPQRQHVQSKMLKLHESVYKKLNKLNLDLHCHWYPQNITSLIDPNIFNHYQVSWMGVRYGKEKSEIEQLLKGAIDSDPQWGFPKHGCLQFSISSTSFNINLFHAVRHEAYDRYFLHEKLEKFPLFKNELINKLKILKGTDYYWGIWDSISDKEIANFDFNNQKAEDFIDFYLQHDQDGLESFLALSFDPDDEQINNQNIVSTIVEEFRFLNPLYQTMVQRFGR